MASALASEIHHRGAREAAIFCERFIEDLLNCKASDDRDVLDKKLRQLLATHCHPHYVHGINVRELNQETLADNLKHLRSMIRSIKVRLKQIVVDQDGTADMRHCRIGFVYEMVAEREHVLVKKTKSKDSASSDTSKLKSHGSDSSSKSSHVSIEERRSTGIGVAKISHSKIERVDLSLDTQALKQDPTELGCSIM